MTKLAIYSYCNNSLNLFIIYYYAIFYTLVTITLAKLLLVTVLSRSMWVEYCEKQLQGDTLPCSDVGAGSEPDKSQQEVLSHTLYQHYQNAFCLVTGETK